jgi:hypothetical protein
MQHCIIIANPYRWHLPYFIPKPPRLSPNVQTFIYTNPYVKIIETPDDIETNYRKIKKPAFNNKDKERVPPPPPVSPKRNYNNKSMYTNHKW